MEKLDPALLDQEVTLVNLSSSILHHFEVTPFHSTLKELDPLLEKHKKIALFLFDGSGEYDLKMHKHRAKYILSHQFMKIHSVNPATTVACTTSLLTGKFPMETGWLGWSLYMKDLGYPVDVFPNKNTLTGEELSTPDYMRSLCPTKNIVELIGEKGYKAKAMYQYPVNGGQGPKTLKEGETMATSFFNDGGDFLYFYWTEPDSLIHPYGVKSGKVGRNLKKISKTIKTFAKHNPDVLVLSIADHGLIDVQYRNILAYPELAPMLEKPISLEGRTPTFFVKEGKKEEFKAAFEKRFPMFTLYPTDELLTAGYFGLGEINPHTRDFLGDFVGVTKGHDLIVNPADHPETKGVYLGHHAGATDEERDICLAAYNV